MTTPDAITGGHRIMRWWPMVYAFAWAVFAAFAVEPQLLGTGGARWIAAAGAVLMFALAIRPDIKWLRVVATLVAFTFPAYRFLTLALEPTPFLPTASRIVAMTAWALICLTIVILYPAVWYQGFTKGQRRGIE